MVIDILSWVFLLLGAFFMLVAGIGVLRLPDLYTRMHAATLKDTLGAGFTLLGLILQGGFTLVSGKLLLIWLFLWFTSPVSSHSVVRGAITSGIRPLLGNPPRPHPPISRDGSDPRPASEEHPP